MSREDDDFEEEVNRAPQATYWNLALCTNKACGKVHVVLLDESDRVMAHFVPDPAKFVESFQKMAYKAAALKDEKQ